MRITNTSSPLKKNSRLPKVVAIAIVAVLLIGVGVYALTANNNVDDTQEIKAPTTTQEDLEKKKEIIDKSKAIDTRDPDAVTDSQTGSITITKLSQQNSVVTVAVDVANFDIQKCVYQFESEGARPVVEERTGDCPEVSINEAFFDKIGVYSLTVTAYDSSNKIQATQTINIR